MNNGESEDMTKSMRESLVNYLELGSPPFLSLWLHILQFIHWEPVVVPSIGLWIFNFQGYTASVQFCTFSKKKALFVGNSENNCKVR